MTTLQQKIDFGYKSLAGRTLDLYLHIEQYIPNFDQNRAYKEKFKGLLKEMRDQGNILAGDPEVLLAMRIMLNEAIPYAYRARNADQAFALGSIAVMEYKNETDPEEFIRSLRLDGRIVSTEYAGFNIQVGEGSQRRRLFQQLYREGEDAISVISTCHELIHCRQENWAEIERIIEGTNKIPHFGRLEEHLRDPRLNARMVEISKALHVLHFYDLPEVRELARASGVDMEAYDRFIVENMPKLDALMCFVEGEAYIAQGDIISNASFLKGDPLARKDYELIALVDALLAPLINIKGRVYYIGNGLFEYFKIQPNQKEGLVTSPEFHREVSTLLVTR